MWSTVMNNLYPILGWVGTLAYLLAYFLLSINKINSNQLIYHALNIIGAIGLTTNALYYAYLPNVVVNLVWGLIALTALIVLYRKRKKKQN
jgi:ABC-type transport system involved in multi-copper enzyme maturation permease subunit